MGSLIVNQDAKAAIDKSQALRAVDEWFANAISEGFTTQSGIHLGLADSDVTLLTGNFVLAKEAAALDAPLPALIDATGAAHEIESIEELTAIMLAYGNHRAGLSAEYAARKAAIEV